MTAATPAAKSCIITALMTGRPIYDINVGHILAPLLHVVFVQLRPEPWIMALGFGVGSVALCLYLLPRVKGGVVAFQWARRLNGFGADASGNVLKTQ